MESKPKILHGECLLFVDGGGEELTIVDATLVVKVDGLEDVLQVRGAYVRVLERLLHLIQIEQPCVVLVQGAESFPQTLEIYYIFC
jgi:hypothetical protein